MYSDQQNAKIESQSLRSLECAFRQLVDMEVEHERKLNTIKELKVRIMIEIDFKINGKS